MFKAAVNLKENYAEAHKNLGISLKDLGRFESAEKSFIKAISINNSYEEAFYNLAITQKESKKLLHTSSTCKKYFNVLKVT